MTVRPVSSLVVEVLDGEAVIFAPTDGRVHRLNATATRWWSNIAAGIEPDDPDDREEYAEFVEQLATAGLVVDVDGPRR